MDEPASITEQLGPRQGGGQWRAVELECAERRARGETWPAIAKAVGYSKSTVHGYTARPWWGQAYSFFVDRVAAERQTAMEEERLAVRDAWMDTDDELKSRGVQMAMGVLIEAMSGRRYRDEDRFRELLTEGVDRMEADRQAREGNPVPVWNERVWAAKEMLKGSGYVAAAEGLAKSAVRFEEDRRRRDADRGEGLEIDIGIRGVDAPSE